MSVARSGRVQLLDAVACVCYRPSFRTECRTGSRLAKYSRAKRGTGILAGIQRRESRGEESCQYTLVVHNFLSNGFSEEFQCRGMIFSHLRAFLKTDWALLVQAVVFGLLHFHPNGVEEQANLAGSLAEDLALNMPVALAFGFLALRSRSLVLPTFLHLFNWHP
jgi:hypothetical protein